jgi:hypothetical protein
VIAPVETGLKGTAFYGKKLNDGNYGADEAGLYVQFDIDPADGDQQILANVRDAFVKAKVAVLEQLGVDFVVDEQGIVREAGVSVAQVKEVFPGAVVEQSAPAPAAPAAPVSAASVDASGPWYGKRGKAVILNGVDLWDVLADSPEQFYDNRTKKASGEYKANAPDFKHKESGKGLWQS